MFDNLEKINSRPEPFEFYTAEELWTNDHTSKKMLEYHLNNTVDLASRNKDFIHRSVKWISDYFRVDSNTSIADFGCGPGLYTTLFAENHAKVTGIDFSKTSIEYAKNIAAQKGLDICYINKNYLEFKTEKKFDLITMIFCDYCALSPAQRKTLLKKFHSFLKPGGSLFLDVHSINRFNEIKECAIYEINQLNGFWSPEKYYGFLNTFRYEQEKVSLDKYTIIEQSETRVVYNWLQYFTKDSLQKELEENGFRVMQFFSDAAGKPFTPDSPDIAVYAKKECSF
jgi:2-polyprenyl-3-methyl-5-hydroxy-6-metoxy-1,4-benzoquinol methylase